MSGFKMFVEIMENKGVLCDTSFFIRLFKQDDGLHEQAKAYFRYFLDNQYTLYLSTISIAEYCVRGKIDELPLLNLKILPFNVPHAVCAGNFADYVFKNRQVINTERLLIPNDTKLFAQADIEPGITYYLSADKRSIPIYSLLDKKQQLKFSFLDLSIPHQHRFGELF